MMIPKGRLVKEIAVGLGGFINQCAKTRLRTPLCQSIASARRWVKATAEISPVPLHSIQ
jgi:hypothetical protein